MAELGCGCSDALVRAPQTTGRLLGGTVPEGNFRHMPLWCERVVSLAAGLLAAYGREIFGGLRAAGVAVPHVCPRVPPAEVGRRLAGRSLVPDPKRDEAIRDRCGEQNAAWAAAAEKPRDDAVLLDGARPVAGPAGTTAACPALTDARAAV